MQNKSLVTLEEEEEEASEGLSQLKKLLKTERDMETTEKGAFIFFYFFISWKFLRTSALI